MEDMPEQRGFGTLFDIIMDIHDTKEMSEENELNNHLKV